MKVGDRVKVLPPSRRGDHEWSGSLGTVVSSRPYGFTWDFDVLIDGEPEVIPFYDSELGVIV